MPACNKRECKTRCTGQAGVEVTATPKVLCSPPQCHSCKVPLDLKVDVTPRCRLVKAPCAQTSQNCQTRCAYTLEIDMDIKPDIQIGCGHTCKKFFDFSVEADYKTRCIGGADNSSSSSAACKPCGGKAAHKYSKSCRCGTCAAWRRAH